MSPLEALEGVCWGEVHLLHSAWAVPHMCEGGGCSPHRVPERALQVRVRVRVVPIVGGGPAA